MDTYNILYKEIKEAAKTHKPLGKEMELKLIREYIRTKNKSIKDKIYLSNMKVIVGEVKKFHTNKGLNPSIFMDLVSLGLTEGYECIERFNPEEGNASLCSWIRNSAYRAISNYIKENCSLNGEFSPIRTPINWPNEMFLHEKALNVFSHNHHRFPTSGEKMEYEGKTVSFFKKNNISVTSGNSAAEGGELFDSLDITDPQYDEIDVSPLFVDIAPREAEIYDLLYVRGMQKKEAIFFLTPQDAVELSRAERTGTNPIEVPIGDYLCNISVIYHRNNSKKNPLYHKELNLHYNCIKDGTIVVHTNNPTITVLGNSYNLTPGYAVNAITLTALEKSFISNMRQNKNIKQIYNEYYR